MIDLSSIKQYIEEPNIFIINNTKNRYEKGIINSLLEYDLRSLDCTRITNNGLRNMQTIGAPYSLLITEVVHIIDNYISDEDKDEYYTRLIALHNHNLEFEAINPPVWYGGEKAKREYEKSRKSSSNTKQKRPRQQRLDFDNKEKQPTAAERKLAAKVAKISKLNFNIKPINKDDTV